MTLNPFYVEATTLDDAWHQLVYNIFDKGYYYRIDRGSYAGSYRWEYDWVTVHITKPSEYPRVPQIPESLSIPPPVTEDYVVDYFNKYIIGKEKSEGESYTYGERMLSSNQIAEIIERYKSAPNDNQLILQIAMPSDITLDDPPCLRHIDTRIRYGKLHFFPYFRSWDLWSGFPANLAALQLLKEYMASEIGVADGEIIASSKGLHIYKHVEDIAKIRFYRG